MSIFKRDKRNNKRKRRKCVICGRPTERILSGSTIERRVAFPICPTCNKNQLEKIWQPDRANVIYKALEISKKEEIDVPYAINVVIKKYTLKEAKRRSYPKRRERSGDSIDIFEIGKRTPGSFGSRNS